jgi:hypothetical protein
MLGFHHEKTVSLREVTKSVKFLHCSSHFIAPFHAATAESWSRGGGGSNAIFFPFFEIAMNKLFLA